MNDSGSILIVDDEEQVIRAIQRLFNWKNYKLYQATDPYCALEILKNNQIDLILSDNRMPGMNGIDLLMQAKRISPGTIRILMSAYSDFDVVISAINEGNIYHYIVKPWNNEKFAEIVSTALSFKKEQEEKEKIVRILLKDKEEWTSLIKQLNREINTSKEKAVNALLKVISAKDPDLMAHCTRVTDIALGIATQMELSGQQKEFIKYAGLFHDIGKISIRDNILYKADRLNTNEYEEMKKHPAIGADILKELDFMNNISDIILQHHERVDGKGYPQGLKSDQILLESKIISIADTYDALVSDRVYRDGMSVKEALDLLIYGKGTQYDSHIVELFADHILKI